ncbi:hypothetical protein B0J11DRAFT_468169 [Dendryphion nanum]|uniref:Uncharacterized protein n=1 Tax=Dendryphion nanum TaxID=256645 RepID=A0A9P9DEF0_9PLEO|nr:hypothetical protein B0J11DRAFT_468169 [Dendryphion nanum]
MLSRVFILTLALRTAIATTVDLLPRSESRLSQFLQEHSGENDFGLDGHNVTNPSFGHDIESREIQSRALGKAIIANRCPYDIWIWSVDQKGSKGPIQVKARNRYSEPFRTPCERCGVSLKVSRTNQLQSGKHTQFEYAIAKDTIYYDISYVDCAKGNSAKDCPGHEKGHMIDSAEKACGVLKCQGGSYCPTQSYYVDKPKEKLGIPEPVLGCGNKGTGMDIWFTMCSDEKPLKRSVAGRLEIDDMA